MQKRKLIRVRPPMWSKKESVPFKEVRRTRSAITARIHISRADVRPKGMFQLLGYRTQKGERFTHLADPASNAYRKMSASVFRRKPR
jgi:hypothetical protein